MMDDENTQEVIDAEDAMRREMARDLQHMIAEVILDNIDRAAAASHRPEHVRFWLDANARYVLAGAIVEAIGDAA